jgi:hypothetical protein
VLVSVFVSSRKTNRIEKKLPGMIPDSKGWGILSRMIRANDDGGRKKKT